MAHVIVVGNEKGGAGKSTVAMHLIASLLQGGGKVGVFDLDLRQQTLGRFFANRLTWAQANQVVLPSPEVVSLSEDDAALARREPAEAVERFGEAFEKAKAEVDFIVMDTPGTDNLIMRAAHGKADRIVTPINDSFVDFDMLGHLDPVTLDLAKPSLYSETVWEARKTRITTERRTIDWLVLRNRLATSESRNRKRLDERVQALSRRVGFRVGPGLRDRVIYRELFPFGLTIADLSASVRPVAVSLSHVAARQELRAIMSALGLEVEPSPAMADDDRRTVTVDVDADVREDEAA
jgi:chromosome partitioning protein